MLNQDSLFKDSMRFGENLKAKILRATTKNFDKYGRQGDLMISFFDFAIMYITKTQ